MDFIDFSSPTSKSVVKISHMKKNFLSISPSLLVISDKINNLSLLPMVATISLREIEHA